ncbi:MAG: hypothetical protein ACOH2F_14095 [Cellulomonas sp.]
MIAIPLGMRRGEVLGLSCSDVEFDAGRLHVRRQLQQRAWLHGCADPDRCVDRGADCPERTGGGLVLAELKTRQSRRTLPLPEPLIVFHDAAGVRPAWLHDARHTAATLLLVQGVDQRVVTRASGS